MSETTVTVSYRTLPDRVEAAITEPSEASNGGFKSLRSLFSTRRHSGAAINYSEWFTALDLIASSLRLARVRHWLVHPSLPLPCKRGLTNYRRNRFAVLS